MRIRQRRGELVAIGGIKPEALPERTRPAAEQPRPPRALLSSAGECEGRERAAATTRPVSRPDRDAANQRVLTVAAELVPGAADDHARFIPLQPQPNARGVKAAPRQIDLAQECCERRDILRPAPLEIHPRSQSPQGSRPVAGSDALACAASSVQDTPLAGVAMRRVLDIRRGDAGP